MAFDAIEDAEIDTGKMAGKTLWQKVKDCLDWLYGEVATLGGGLIGISNGSFEIDADIDGVPDGWTVSLYPGGTAAIDTTTPYHGASAVKLTHPGGAGNGGGYYESDYVACMTDSTYLQRICFATMASVAGMKNQVEVRYYTAAKIYISSQFVYNSTSNPASWTPYQYALTVPATARFFKVRLIGGYTDTNVAGIAYFDNVYTDSTPTVFADSTIDYNKLKRAYGDVSTNSTGNFTLPGGYYGFYPQMNGGGANALAYISAGNVSGYATNIYMDYGGSGTLYARQYYITASGTEHWLFLLYDKTAGRIVSAYSAPDHPCANNGGNEKEIPHPFADYVGKELPAALEIIVLDKDSIAALKAMVTEGKYRGILHALNETIGGTHEFDMKQEVPWTARDLDGKQKLTEKSATWTQRRIVEKKGA